MHVMRQRLNRSAHDAFMVKIKVETAKKIVHHATKVSRAHDEFIDHCALPHSGHRRTRRPNKACSCIMIWRVFVIFLLLSSTFYEKRFGRTRVNLHDTLADPATTRIIERQPRRGRGVLGEQYYNIL